MRGRPLNALAVAACVGLAGPAFAQSVEVPYRAVLDGVEIGAGALVIDVDGSGGGYRLELHALLPERNASKAVRATAHAAGRITRGSLQPELYSADFDKAGTKSRVALAFADGAVRMVAVLPPHPAGSGRTRPPESQSRGVIDPLSALVVPAARGGLAPLSACGRTQRIFDGVTRYDVALFPSRVETIEVAGSALATLVCRAELRSNLGPTPRLRRWPETRPQGLRALIWLAPVADGRLLAPARMETDLRFGRLVIEATEPGAFHTAVRAAALR